MDPMGMKKKRHEKQPPKIDPSKMRISNLTSNNILEASVALDETLKVEGSEVVEGALLQRSGGAS